MTLSTYANVETISAHVAAQTHPANSITATSALTKSYTGAAGVQVSCWPGWWDGSSTPTTNASGTGANIRTNQTGARITVEVTGTKIFGIKFDTSIWDAENYDGEQWITRPSIWCYRLTTNGTPGSWVYGNRASASAAGWIFLHDLTTTSTYVIEMEPTHITDPINVTAPSGISLLDFVREPQLTGTAGYPVNEQGAFQQITGFVTTTGATFNNVTFALAALNVMVYGDSNSHSHVLPGSDATVELAEVGATSGEGLELDARGHRITYVRQMLETYATANNKRLVICNSSYGGLWLGEMQQLTRYLYSSVYGALNLAASPINRVAARHGWTGFILGTPASASTYPEYNRPLPSGWTPDLAVVSLVTNDQVIGGSLIGNGQGAETAALHHNDTLFRDDAVAFINAVHAAWASCKVLAINNHLSDSSFPSGVGSHYYFDIACRTGFLDLDATNWARYANLRDLVSTTVIPDNRNTTTHLTPTQHTAAATALATTLNTLMAL